MGIKTYNPYTPSRRQMTGSDFSEITKKTGWPQRAGQDYSKTSWRRS